VIGTIVVVILELILLFAHDVHRRGNEVKETELVIVFLVRGGGCVVVVSVVLDLGGVSLFLGLLELTTFAYAVFAFRTITVLADQGRALANDDKAATETTIHLVDIVVYQMALHGVGWDRVMAVLK